MPHHAPTSPADGVGDLAPEEIQLAGAIVAGFLSIRPRLLEEREDLVQECLEHWLRRRARYDARRGAAPRTFMRRVLERHLLDIERTRTTEKRGGGTPDRSLDQQNGEGTSLRDTLPSREDPEVAALLTIALEQALSKLTPEQRVLTDALISGQQMADVARVAKRARSSLYRDLARIRDVFREEWLDEFL